MELERSDKGLGPSIEQPLVASTRMTFTCMWDGVGAGGGGQASGNGSGIDFVCNPCPAGIPRCAVNDIAASNPATEEKRYRLAVQAGVPNTTCLDGQCIWSLLTSFFQKNRVGCFRSPRGLGWGLTAICTCTPQWYSRTVLWHHS